MRIFSAELEPIHDNAPNRLQTHRVYRDEAGGVVSVPPPGPSRERWPVRRALLTGRPVQDDYCFRAENGGGDECYRVRAWPLPGGPTGETLVVEEIERIDEQPLPDGRLKQFDTQLSDLIGRVTEFVAHNSDPRALRLRLTGSGNDPCPGPAPCAAPEPPGERPPSATRCWELNSPYCRHGNEAESPLEKFHFCNRCEVFVLACPDPLSHVSENLNRLLSLLQLKYQEALEAQQQVQQAEKLAAIGELMLGLAHEIKNPLSVILGRLDCLLLELEALSVEDLTRDLEVLREHATRMRRVLEEVLTLSRPNPPQPCSIRLAEQIERVLAIVRTTLEKSGIEVKAITSTRLPSIHADPFQVQQALLNLVLNARDAMPQGGSLTIRTRRHRKSPPGVTVSLTDTGHGIAPGEMDRIFSPFYSTKTERGGTGLGLAITQRIMVNHGGRIDVTSVPGNGSTFALWFPLLEDGK